MKPWRVVARNLASHATNPIHTDAGARAAGYPSALVAGVTVHAWLTHPPVEAWGDDWLRAGSGSVRFRRPVFDGDVVEVVPTPQNPPDDDGTVVVQAVVGGEVRAELITRPPGRTDRPDPTGAASAPDRTALAIAGLVVAVPAVGTSAAVTGPPSGTATSGNSPSGTAPGVTRPSVTLPSVTLPSVRLPETARHERLVPDATQLRPGQDLGSIPFVLGGPWGASYAGEVGDDLDRYRPGYRAGGVVHPGVWLEAAHLAFTRNLALASWIHTESTYQHHAALVAPDTAVSVRSRVRDATVRKRRDELTLDVQIVDAASGNVLVSVDHRAIVRLP